MANEDLYELLCDGTRPWGVARLAWQVAEASPGVSSFPLAALLASTTNVLCSNILAVYAWWVPYHVRFNNRWHTLRRRLPRAGERLRPWVHALYLPPISG
jgi:hypothetical protein